MISGFSTIAAAVVILLCITAQCTAQGTDCSAMVADADCSFYDCVHTKFRCDGKGYALRCGKPDCQRYVSESNCFTPAVSTLITLMCVLQSTMYTQM